MEEMRRAAAAFYNNLTDEYKQKAMDLFGEIDANRDGSISIQEFMDFLQSVGYAWLSDSSIFTELDRDRNGSLEFEEFLTFFYICLSGRLMFCRRCRVFLKGLYFTCVQCFETRSFDLCCDCFQSKDFAHHAGAAFCDNYALLRSRSGTSSGTSSYSSGGLGSWGHGISSHNTVIVPVQRPSQGLESWGHGIASHNTAIVPVQRPFQGLESWGHGIASHNTAIVPVQRPFQSRKWALLEAIIAGLQLGAIGSSFCNIM